MPNEGTWRVQVPTRFLFKQLSAMENWSWVNTDQDIDTWSSSHRLVRQTNVRLKLETNIWVWHKHLNHKTHSFYFSVISFHQVKEPHPHLGPASPPVGPHPGPWRLVPLRPLWSPPQALQDDHVDDVQSANEHNGNPCGRELQVLNHKDR